MRPGRAERCPFCPGNEAETPPEIFSLRDGGQANEPGWRLRIVPNKFPALRLDGVAEPGAESCCFRVCAAGAHEVIIEGAEHTATWSDFSIPRLVEVLEAIRQRIADLQRDPRVQSVFFFKNHGEAAGATLEHPHSQLLALPLVPKLVAEEIAGARRRHGETGRCYFCELIEGELAGGGRLVAETGQAVALAPYAARAPYETWLLPKRHDSHFETVEPGELVPALRTTLRKLDRVLGYPAYNVVLHTAPVRETALGHYHWHFELIPRLTKLAGFEWGTGFYMNPVPPEEAARRLREAVVE